MTQSIDLTPAQQELLLAIHALSDDDGRARSLFKIGVVEAGFDYMVAYRILKQLRRMHLVHVRRLRNAQGRPLVIRLLVAKKENV